MKTKLLTALVVLGSAVGCVTGDTPVDLGNAKAFNAECKRDDGISQGGGALNVGLSSAFVISFDVISTLQPVKVSSATGTITDTTQNEAVIEEIRYTYSATPDIIGLKDITDSTYVVVAPGSTGSWIKLNLFPGEAGDTLAASVVPGDRVAVTVGVQLAGKLRSGTPFTTAVANFPVTVENKPCPAETVPALNVGPCGNVGQDGAFLMCCPPDNLGCWAGAGGAEG